MKELVRFLGKDPFNHILVNAQKPPKALIDVYATEGDLVENDLEDDRVIFANMLGGLKNDVKCDLMKRSLIRHDSKKVAQELMKIVDHL